MKKKLSNIGRITLISVIFVLISTLFDSNFVKDESELKSMKFGIPFAFMEQDESIYSPPIPYRMSACSQLECPTKFHIVPFFVDLMIVGVIVALVFMIIEKFGKIKVSKKIN